MKAWLLGILRGRKCSAWWLLLPPLIGAVFALTFPEQPTGALRQVADALAWVNGLFPGTLARASSSPLYLLAHAYYGLMWLFTVPLVFAFLCGDGRRRYSEIKAGKRQFRHLYGDVVVVAMAGYFLLATSHATGGTWDWAVATRGNLAMTGWMPSLSLALAVSYLSVRAALWRAERG